MTRTDNTIKDLKRRLSAAVVGDGIEGARKAAKRGCWISWGDDKQVLIPGGGYEIVSHAICPKCGKKAWRPRCVIRYGKDPERAYSYLMFVHPIDGRTKRNKSCYVPVKE